MSGYKNGQEQDHKDYESGLDAKPLTNDIPLMNRANTWEDRPSDDRLLNERASSHDYHQRAMSGHSVSTIIGEPIQEEAGGYGGSNPQYSTRQPTNAYTQDPGPTPQFSDNYHLGGGGNIAMSRPLPSHAHPGES